MNNRKHNCKNPNQGDYKKVLCVCSAGLLRSPSLAVYLSNQGYNTRACGSNPEYALIVMDAVLIEWADLIVFVNKENYNTALFYNDLSDKEIVTLNIPDVYEYRSPRLMEIIQDQCIEKGIN